MFDKLIQSLFGEGMSLGKDGIMGILGSDQMANIVKGITSWQSGQQMGDMLNMQKDLAYKAEGRTEQLFQDDQEARKRRRDINFG